MFLTLSLSLYLSDVPLSLSLSLSLSPYYLSDVPAIEALSKHCCDKNVDEKGDEERNGRLHKEILVCLLDVIPLRAIHVPRL